MPTRNLIPKYKCKHIAQEVSRLLQLTPALDWSDVREYAEPRMIGGGTRFLERYDAELRPLIRSALLREIRMQHVWTP